MTKRKRNECIDDLTSLLDRLGRLHAELETAVETKIDAIKSADLDALAKASTRGDSSRNSR